ncbi:MAG: hypothetical protein NT062_01350 [Proteobacteria bacterium]|nr:hypothetical protein [Pseudomonadota bacterium]
MRAAVLTVALLGACSVSDKHAIEIDAGIEPTLPDAPIPDHPPDTTITSSPAEFSSVAVAVFTFTSDDPTATFACSVDGDTPVPCATPYTRSLGDGPHGFVVRASTAAGANDDTPAEHVWTIDTIAPTTTITMGPPAIDNSSSVTFAFTSDEDNVSFDCAVDGDLYAGCTTGQLFEDLADGQHTIAVRAHDRAGNLDASPAIRAWVIDSSTPDTQLLSGPSGPTSSTTAAFTFLSPDAGAGATFQCRLDAAPFTSCTSPTNLINLPAGSHGFAVRVRDSAGNLDPTPAGRAWVVDLTPPETTILTGPTGMVATASATFTFEASEDGTFACSLDGAAFTACTSPVFVALLAQGAHALSIRATDLAGHLDATPAGLRRS